MVVMFHYDGPMDWNYILANFLVGGVLSGGKIYGRAGKMSLHL
jgi:hypothetical protein